MMNECKHNNVHIDVTVTLYADSPRADGSYTLGVSERLEEATVEYVTCSDCDASLDAYGGKMVGTWLRDFYTASCDRCAANDRQQGGNLCGPCERA